MKNPMKIVIIGGGASGLAAAVTAAMQSSEAEITVLEKKEKCASKIAATGNGRCNITNDDCSEKEAVFDFFKRLGIFVRCERGGRFYPVSGKASDVRTALIRKAEGLGVRIVTDSPAEEIRRYDEGFQVVCRGGKIYEADRVLIAAGGKAAPVYGTTGDSYVMARKLGHSVTRLAPALTSLEISNWDSALKGIRTPARVSLSRKGKTIAEETGEIIFTEKGISGVCIFNLSSNVVLDENTSFTDYRLKINFLAGGEGEPEEETEKRVVEMLGYLSVEKEKKHEKLLLADALCTLTDERLTTMIAKQAGLEDAEINSFDSDAVSDIIYVLENFTLKICGAGGWDKAQCTRGGVVCDEVDENTCESKLVPGLYIAGEALDYDGPCGGFNLHHAWLTGIKAGRAMAEQTHI